MVGFKRHYQVGVANLLTVGLIDRAQTLKDDLDAPVAAEWVTPDTVNYDEFPNVKGKTFLWVKNTDSSNSITVTFVVTTAYSGIDLPDLVHTLTAGQEDLIGPFTEDFENVNKRVEVRVSGTGAANAYIMPVKLQL